MQSELNKSTPEDFINKPRVKFSGADFYAQIGSYPVAFISKNLESTGFVYYHHLLVVGDEAENDIYFVSAESNPIDGSEGVYLCSQDPTKHANHGDSPLLVLDPVFFCAACRMVREHFDLDLAAAPIIEAESQALEMIPDLCDKFLQDWQLKFSWVIEYILEGLPEAHPGHIALTSALTRMAGINEARVDLCVSENRKAYDKQRAENNNNGCSKNNIAQYHADDESSDQDDPLFDQAVEIVVKSRKASISLVMRHLRIGYFRATRLVEQMERTGVVTPMQSNGKREVIAPISGARF